MTPKPDTSRPNHTAWKEAVRTELDRAMKQEARLRAALREERVRSLGDDQRTHAAKAR